MQLRVISNNRKDKIFNYTQPQSQLIVLQRKDVDRIIEKVSASVHTATNGLADETTQKLIGSIIKWVEMYNRAKSHAPKRTRGR